MQLADIRTAIQAHGYTTDTAAQQNIFINQTYRRVHNKERWPFLEKQDSSLLTVVGTPGYTLPMTDWRNLDAVRIEIAAQQQYVNLKYLEPQDFREYEHIDRDTSTPCYWTFINQQLRFYPYPDSVYTVRIDYIYEPPDLTNDTDVPVLPVPYHDILVAGALVRITQRERDWIGNSISQNDYAQLLKQMEEEYLIRQRQTSSHVKRSGYWDTQMPYPFIHEGW